MGRKVLHATVGQHLERLFDRGQIVLGQGTRIGSRVGQGLVALVQALRQLQRGLGREAEAAVGLALQAGQVVQQATGLRGGLAFLFDRGGLAAHRVGDFHRLAVAPDAVGPQFGIGAFLDLLSRGLLEGRVEPFARVFARFGQEAGMDLPVVAALVRADLFFALHDDGQRGRLHAPHSGQEETPVARIEGGHGAGAVDAHHPVGLGAAARRIGQALHLLIALEVFKTVSNGRGRHGLQPQPLHRFAQPLVLPVLQAPRVLLDQAEDQLTLAARVTGVDQAAHVLALGQLDHRGQARLGLVDGLQIEIGRQHRQMGKAPLPALDVELLGRSDLHQVTHCRGDHVGLVLEMVIVLVELARHRGERAHDVLGHGWLFGNDQRFGDTFVFHLYNLLSRAHAPACTRKGARTHARTCMNQPYQIFRP